MLSYQTLYCRTSLLSTICYISVTDEFNKLSKRMSPDSEIPVAKKYRPGTIIKNAIAPQLERDVQEMCQGQPFSVLCDGGTEWSQRKELCYPSAHF